MGQQDLPVAEARRLAGPEALVGLSTHSREQIQAACAAAGADRPDQISVGPVWATPTKEGRPGTGLELIEYAAGEATIPWFAIGGIDAENVSSVVAAGARRVVVVRAIRDAEDPAAAARALREALEAARRGSALMASRERRRAERSKRKARSVERRGQIAARSEERNRAAREPLEPLPRASGRRSSRSGP